MALPKLISFCLLNFIALASCQFIGENTIQSPNVTNFGTWGQLEDCPEGFVTGFQLKVEPKNSVVDDTGLNGIRLFCGGRPEQNSGSNVTVIWHNVTSTVGIFGYWGEIYSCTTYAIGFDLEVVPPRGNYRDDKAATNMKLLCADGNIIEGFTNNGNQHVFEGAKYTGKQECDPGYVVCGIQTQVEDYQVVGDDTALNNVLMKCCPLSLLVG